MITRTLVTCPVELLFAQLDKPTKFQNKEDAKPRFNIKLRIDPSNEQQAKLLADLHEFEQQCFAHERAELEKRIAEGGKDAGKLKLLLKSLQPADSKVPAEYDRDSAEETGAYTLNVARVAEGRKKDGTPWVVTRIPVFDASNPPREITDVASLKIGRGSVVCAKMELSSYLIEGQKSAGMTAKLLGVQIRKLVQFGGGSVSASDFGAGTDGEFSSSASPADQSSDFAADDGGDDIPL